MPISQIQKEIDQVGAELATAAQQNDFARVRSPQTALARVKLLLAWREKKLDEKTKTTDRNAA